MEQMMTVVVVEQMVMLLEFVYDVARGGGVVHGGHKDPTHDARVLPLNTLACGQKGEASIYEGGCGKGDEVPGGGIEVCFVEEVLDIREVEESGNDICSTKAVFIRTEEEEEGNPYEI
eukprot:2857668-Ditylum_brightwellii.AAC.1